MRIKTISRVESDFTRELGTDMYKVHRNYDPSLHPFERAREYTRALNAVKLDKIFAKPFLGSLDGHSDGVSTCATSPQSLVAFLSGACDGEIRVWDLTHKKCVWATYGHSGFVRGLTVAADGQTFFSCGDDKLIKQWKLCVANPNDDTGNNDDSDLEPLNTFYGKDPFMGIDHHWSDALFATCGSNVLVWDHNRSEPIHTFSWGSDSVNSVKFNPAEPCLLASTSSDRNICLYDVRSAQAVRKVVLQMSSNALAWNPMDPTKFTAANEDHNLYTFDMRNLQRACMVHKDHVSAVMDVAYSPTGKEFVSGSYDRTIRIFPIKSASSREVYHTKRMQRIFSVKFSADAKYVLSGSDDTNIRMWKANASESLAKMAPRRKKKADYYEKLKQRYQNVHEIKRIARHRHVPRAIKKASLAKHESRQNELRKEENIRKHSKPGSVPYKNEKSKAIIRELE